MKVHYAEPYLINPLHRVTVDLVGVGGTGSQVLNSLGRINQALIALNHPGLHVRAWDGDTVSPANIGRQLFSSADMGLNKAVVLTNRVNRFFGSEWEGMPAQYPRTAFSNVLISCIDTAKGRVEMEGYVSRADKKILDPVNRQYYWLDLGNLQRTGQVVLGTVDSIKQPKSDVPTASKLKNVVQLFPQLKTIKEADQGPSCSLAEALHKQDLFINSTLAQFGCGLLWKLFREGVIRYQGCYVNLDSFTVNPIKIK